MLASPRATEVDRVASPAPHQPVLLQETVDLLDPSAEAIVVDATLGPGGHALALLEAIGPKGRLYGIDRDPAALAHGAARLSRFGDRFTALRGEHRSLQALLREADVYSVDAILFDLGISSLQLGDARRGFSFLHDGPLDMRMDPDGGPSAAEIVAGRSVEELKEILRRYGEERQAALIARKIVQRRATQPIRSTGELARLVEDALGPRARRYRIHPATRTFQALRIAVNGEIDGLEQTVIDSVALLRRRGRVAVIAYHSLEDRAVKRAFKSLAQRCVCPPRLPVCGCGRENLIRILTTKPVRPSAEEIGTNPRARSAKLRVAERL